MMQSPPRHFVPQSVLPGAGEPHDRLARLAARRAFVELKADFLQAVATLPGHRGEWVREQVRRTEQPIDLYMLRGVVFAELGGQGGRARPEACSWRQTLRRGLDSMFPDSSPPSGFASL